MRLNALRLITAIALLPVSTAFLTGPSLPDAATTKSKTTATLASSSSDNHDVNPNSVPIQRSYRLFSACSIHALLDIYSFIIQSEWRMWETGSRYRRFIPSYSGASTVRREAILSWPADCGCISMHACRESRQGRVRETDASNQVP